MEKIGSIALSNEELHTITFALYVKIPLLKGKAHIRLVVPLYYGQTSSCHSLRSGFTEFYLQ